MIQIKYACENHNIISEIDDLSRLLFIYGSRKIMNASSNEQETCLSEVVQIWSNAMLYKKSGIYNFFWQNTYFFLRRTAEYNRFYSIWRNKGY